MSIRQHPFRNAALGFVREGREWVLPGSDLAFASPGSSLTPAERFGEIELASGRIVRVLSPEDRLLYRLHEFVAGGHAESFRQVTWLLDVPTLDRSRLAVRASLERLRTALGEVQRIAIVRRETGAFPETWDLHELARELRKPGLD